MEYILDFPYKSVKLNSEQYAVVSADPFQHQRILASAGSGKTTTITARIAWLIHKHGIKPESIVLLTFSRNAAREMTTRVKSLVGPCAIWSGTFHGLAHTILTHYSNSSSPGNYFIDELPVRWMQWMRTPKGREWVGSLRYIVVDEFQDINPIQWRLLETMRHIGVRLTIVGDDAQNIYTWRGSSAAFLLDLHTFVKGVHDYQLKMNYRSTEAIVAAANSCMRGIPTLEWKEFMVAAKKGGKRPDVLFFWRMSDECLWVAKTIHEIRKVQPNLSIAVLARNNVDLYRIEEILLQNSLKPRILALDPTDETQQQHLTTKPAQDSVDLATFHGSKGLEWDIVFCISLTDDQLPSRKTTAEIIGERRLFYVAITRARLQLFLTYHGNERKLSRFVREIGYKLLQFHGLANYALSDTEIGLQCPSLQSLLDSLDGDDWQQLRREGLIPWKETERLPFETIQIFPPGEIWSIPDWAEIRDFEAFVRLFIKRCIFQQQGSSTAADSSYHDPLIERMIFTLRIFAEDKEFWQIWQSEIDAMVKHFFKDSTGPPSANYVDVETWIKEKGLPWTQQDIVKATIILGKLRGQLRPLRFDAYSLDEFTICPTHIVAPTEYRADLLRSWRAFQDRSRHWSTCLLEIWRLACLEQVAQGRNAGLFRTLAISDGLKACIPFLEAVERAIIGIFDGQQNEWWTLNPEFAPDDLTPARLDCRYKDGILRICGERRPDLYMWTESCLLGYLSFLETIQEPKYIDILHPFDGKLFSLPFPNIGILKQLYERIIKIWKAKN